MIDQQYKIRIDEDRVKIFNAIIEAFSAIISELKLKLTQKGIEICGMDGSHICLISGILAKEDFADFIVNQKKELTKLEKEEIEEIDRLLKFARLNSYDSKHLFVELKNKKESIEESLNEIALGLNLEDLTKLLKRVKINEKIELTSGEGKSLDITMIPNNAKKVRVFNMALIDIDSEEINMESLKGMSFDNKVKIPIEMMNEAIKDMEIYSEVLQVKVNDNLIFSTEGSIGKYQQTIEKDELQVADFNCESEGSFAIQFMKSIMKIGSMYGTTSTKTFKNASMEIHLKSEAPMKMIFKAMDNSEIQYWLAPRVEEDTDTMYGDEPTPTKKPEVKIESPAQVPMVQVPTLTFKQFGDALASQIKLEGFNTELQETMKYIEVMESDKNGLKQKLIESEGKDFEDYKKAYDTINNTLREEKRDLEEMKSFMGKF